MKIGFDQEKYLAQQSKYILERVEKFDKLYLEFGGKLIRDSHAKRVLPGYDEDAKVKLLYKLKDDVEVIICVYSGHIERGKVIGDSGISYDMDVLRLIDDLRKYSLTVNSVVITRYTPSPLVDSFVKKLERRGIKTYKNPPTPGYPSDIDKIVSKEGYGQNEFIKSGKKIVVVTAPGPGSGKLATCLSQLYHESIRGTNAGYSKFETFPVWDLALNHPVNAAYEAATADLKDRNVIDNFHMDAYNQIAVNYNRDMESFPLLKKMLERITGKPSIFNSPTDMGVNKISEGIIDDEVVSNAAKQEIIRRYMLAKSDYVKGDSDSELVERLEILTENMDLKEEDRKAVLPARQKAKEILESMGNIEDENFTPTVLAIELDDGKVITGKSSDLMEASAAAMLNSLKYLANIPDEIYLISPVVLEPIQKLKRAVSSSNSSVLGVEDIMIALSISAATNPTAQSALEKLPKMKNKMAHSTTIMNPNDERFYFSMEISVTCDPVFPNKNLFYI